MLEYLVISLYVSKSYSLRNLSYPVPVLRYDEYVSDEVLLLDGNLIRPVSARTLSGGMFEVCHILTFEGKNYQLTRGEYSERKLAFTHSMKLHLF